MPRSPKTDMVAEMAQSGYTLAEIAVAVDLTYNGVRSALTRRGLTARREDALTYYERVSEMPPSEAVKYLLDVVYNLAEALNAIDAPHPVDNFGHVTRLERRLLRALYDAGSAGRSVSSLMHMLYFDKVGGDLPDDKIIAVLVCKLRKRLPKHIILSNIHGYGYRMTVLDIAEEATP